MSRLPVVSGRQAARAFENAGWSLARRRGSHMIFTRKEEETTLSVPDHRELRPGLLRSLIRDAGLTVEEFRSYL